MATVYLYPAGTCPYNTGNWNHQSSWPTECQTNDGDTSFIWCGTFYSYEMFAGNFDDLPAGSIAVSQVDATDISKKTEASTLDKLAKLHRVGTSNYYGTLHTLANGTYNAYTDTNVTYGPGGGWTPSNVNSILWGGREEGSGSSTPQIRITQMYLYVTYTPGGGCIIRAFSHLLPLLGTLTTLAELQRFLSFCHSEDPNTRAIPTYNREELEMIQQKLRNLKRSYSCPSTSQFRRMPGKTLYSLAA